MTEELLRIALIGAARITPKVAFALPSRIAITGIASRDELRARAFAERYGVGLVYGSYYEALKDPDVEAVYIATPCSEHVPWALAALDAGKHVLVEKPFALSRRDAERAVERAAEVDRILVEAHHSVFHPLTAPFRDAISRLHQVSSVEVIFDAPIREESDIRLNPSLGAGVLLDFGGYLFTWLEWVRSARDVRGTQRTWDLHVLSAKATCRPTEVDRSFSAEVECRASGETFAAHMSVTMEPDCAFQARVVVRGRSAQGLPECVHFENPLALEGSYLEQPGRTRVPARGPATFAGQLDAFYRAVRMRETPPHAGANILALASLLDAAYNAAGLLPRDALAGRLL